MREQLRRTVEIRASSSENREPVVLGVSIYDDRGEQVETFQSVVLTFGGSIADFALTANAQGVFQSVVCLPFIQPNECTALHVGIKQPVDDEQGAVYTPNFPQRWAEFMLTRRSSEIPQELAWWHDTCSHGVDSTEDVWPDFNDQSFSYLAADLAT